MQTIALHHILLKSSLLAQDIAQELELGADFTELAREYSACPSGKEGGFAGYHPQDDLPIALINALATHDDTKSFAGPVETPLGFHLLKPVGDRPKLALSDQDLSNPDLSNPDLSNPDLSNQSLNDQSMLDDTTNDAPTPEETDTATNEA